MMQKHLIISATMLALALCCSTPKAFGESKVTCPKTTFADLTKTRRGQGKTKIVFFASWCSSCIEQLINQQQPEQTIFVAVFDEQASAERVARKFAINRPCFTSDGIEQALAVKALPALRFVDF